MDALTVSCGVDFKSQSFRITVMPDFPDADADEHERYRLFAARLADLRELSDSLLESLIAEATGDSDLSLSESLLGLIAVHDALTRSQRHSLFRHAYFQRPFLQRLLQRATLIEFLGSGPLSVDLFARCLASMDNAVQRRLLEHPRIRRDQLDELSRHGANRAIRNIATQKLRSGDHGGGGGAASQG